MAHFTREIMGVIIEEEDNLNEQPVDLGEALRGRKKSKKPQNKDKGLKKVSYNNIDFRTREHYERDRLRRENLKNLNGMISENKKKRYEKAKLRLEEKIEREKQ